MNQSRQPAGIPIGGQFSTGIRGEQNEGVLVDRPNPLESMTPSEIDGELAKLLAETDRLTSRLNARTDSLHRRVGDTRSEVFDRRRGRTTYGPWAMSLDEVRAEAASRYGADDSDLKEVNDLTAKLYDLADQTDAREAEFDARGGWSRAFLAQSSDGHVHSSMGCSTCNRGASDTRFAWMTDYSGKDEADIVADAGWRACTVCYPSAPVGTPESLPTKMFSDDEKKAQEARQEREAKRAAAKQKAIDAGLTADGSELVLKVDGVVPGHTRTEYFKTERAAVTWVTDQMAYGRGNMATVKDFNDSGTQTIRAIRTIAEAMAAKHGRTVEDVLDELANKAMKKRKSYGW